jgi:hypothetical protein
MLLTYEASLEEWRNPADATDSTYAAWTVATVRAKTTLAKTTWTKTTTKTAAKTTEATWTKASSASNS